MATTPPKTARYAAIETLNRLQRTRYALKPLLDTVSDECALLSTDRGLTMNLVYGVLRHRQYLEFIITDLSNHPLHKLDPFVLHALTVGLYQLFFFDRIPDSAAVNESVKAVKSAKLPKRLHGFVNGILRTAVRQRERLLPIDVFPGSGKPVLNHPAWMTERWRRQFGTKEMERICKVNNQEPPFTLRTNSSRITRNDLIDFFKDRDITARPGSYAPDSVVLPDFHGSVTKLPGYQEGYFQPQDEAAQLATLLLGPFTPKGIYLDGCAGLGGKTSHLLELVSKTDGQVTAVEPEPQRQRLLEDNINRLSPDFRPTIHKTKLQDYCRTSRMQFSGVLIDAPCSGTGVTGRHPDIRWNRSADDLSKYQREQLDILKHAADLVSHRGTLVYATCSLEAEENQDVINKFLQQNKDFTLTDCSPLLPEAARIFVQDNFFCPRPTPSIDGFFAARLQRME